MAVSPAAPWGLPSLSLLLLGSIKNGIRIRTRAFVSASVTLTVADGAINANKGPWALSGLRVWGQPVHSIMHPRPAKRECLGKEAEISHLPLFKFH